MATRHNFEADPEAPDERFLAFLERHRLQATHQRQQRNYVIVIACLGLTCVVLAGSTLILALRLSAGRALVAVASSSLQPVSQRESRSMPLPEARAAAPRASASVSESVSSETTRAMRQGEPTPKSERAAREPLRASMAPRQRDPAWRTAAWMVRTYGKFGAAERARAAAAFYDPADPATHFWKEVLAHIREGAAQ